MGQNTLFEDHRSPMHVQCWRLLLVALVPGVIGMASEHWLAAPSSGGSGEEQRWGQVRNMGLWAVCSNFSRCASLPSADFPDAYGPVRVLAMTSIFLHMLSLLVGLLCSCKDPDSLMGINVYVPRLEEILAVVAGILMGGALGIFAQTTQQHPVYHTFHLDWSFWTMVVYVFFLLLAGGVIVLIRNECACWKSCTRFCRHCEQTTLCVRIGKPKPPQENGFSLPVIEHDCSANQTLKESHIKFFTEKETQDPKCLLGSTLKASRQEEHSQFLERMKDLGHVYSSLEGLPRVVQMSSEKADDTETV